LGQAGFADGPGAAGCASAGVPGAGVLDLLVDVGCAGVAGLPACAAHT
jgi:hypothetical protein